MNLEERLTYLFLIYLPFITEEDSMLRVETFDYNIFDYYTTQRRLFSSFPFTHGQ